MRAVERHRVVERERAQPLFAAESRVAVGMGAVEQTQERTFGQRRRHVLHLPQPIEAQLADAREIRLAEAGPREEAREELRAAIREPRQRRQREADGVGAGVHVVVAADARQRIRHVDGAEVAGALVHQIRHQRRQPLPRGGVGARPAFDLEDEGDDRHAGVLHRAHAQPVRQHVALDAGKREGGRRSEPGKRRAIDRFPGHQDTDTGTEPGNASRGAAAGHDAQHHAAGRRQIPAGGVADALARRQTIAVEIAAEEPGVALHHVVGVELIGLAAEAANRLQVVDELRLGLRLGALHLGAGRPVGLEPAELFVDRRGQVHERRARGRRHRQREEARRSPATAARRRRPAPRGGRRPASGTGARSCRWRACRRPGRARRRRARTSPACASRSRDAAAPPDPRARAGARRRAPPPHAPVEGGRRRGSRRNSDRPARRPARWRCRRRGPARRWPDGSRCGRTRGRRRTASRGCRRPSRSSSSDRDASGGNSAATTAISASPYGRFS